MAGLQPIIGNNALLGRGCEQNRSYYVDNYPMLRAYRKNKNKRRKTFLFTLNPIFSLSRMLLFEDASCYFPLPSFKWLQYRQSAITWKRQLHQTWIMVGLRGSRPKEVSICPVIYFLRRALWSNHCDLRWRSMERLGAEFLFFYKSVLHWVSESGGPLAKC